MDSDYVTIEEATATLDVDAAVLKAFIKANSGTIDSRVIGGVRRFSLADLEKIQDGMVLEQGRFAFC